MLAPLVDLALAPTLAEALQPAPNDEALILTLDPCTALFGFGSCHRSGPPSRFDSGNAPNRGSKPWLPGLSQSDERLTDRHSSEPSPPTDKRSKRWGTSIIHRSGDGRLKGGWCELMGMHAEQMRTVEKHDGARGMCDCIRRCARTCATSNPLLTECGWDASTSAGLRKRSAAVSGTPLKATPCADHSSTPRVLRSEAENYEA